METKNKSKYPPVRDLYMEGRQSLLPVIKEIMKQNLSYSDPGEKRNAVGITVKTTSMNASIAEILQIILSDEDGKILFSSFVKPYCHEKWHDAERIHRISPLTVKDAPYLHQLMPEICHILNGADYIVAYDCEFAMALLKTYGYSPSGFPVDLMRDFAKLYGEVSTKYNCFQYKSLYVAASYFGYDYPKGYDAENDAAALMFLHSKIQELKESGDYDAIVENNYKVLKADIMQEE